MTCTILSFNDKKTNNKKKTMINFLLLISTNCWVPLLCANYSVFLMLKLIFLISSRGIKCLP